MDLDDAMTDQVGTMKDVVVKASIAIRLSFFTNRFDVIEAIEILPHYLVCCIEIAIPGL